MCNLTCIALFAVLEWKLSVLRTVAFWFYLMVERMRAPKISVPEPKVIIDSTPAAEPLQPSAAGPGLIQCYEKGTNKPLGVVKALSPDEVKEAVKKARVAQVEWAKSSYSERRRLMYALLDYVIAKHKLLCETSSVECGKTLLDGTLGEILTTCEKLSWTIQHGEAALADESRSVGLITIHKKAVLRYVPFGVIGAIVSWNYPVHNIIGPMISALFAGNAFVGKVSEYSSYYASYYESIVQAGLKELGYSPDLVRFVTGFAETGSALVECVDKLTFIGSPGVGKLVMEKASKTLTPVVLELGGKDPAIVLDDADMEQVLPIILRGTFQNCGQNCVGVERVVAQTRVYDEILRRTTEVVKQMSQGATPVGKDDEIKCLGAMTMGLKQCANIQDLVTRSVAAGARLVVGGDWTEAKGTFFPPTILADVRPGMPIAEHEVFGPVLVLMKFTTDDEAVSLVNSCPYGLGSNVFGSPARAKALGQRLHTGMMNVNDFAINYLCQSLPFGGVKISGFDRFAGIEGLRGCCVLRAETYDRIPGVKTLVPPILQYPMSTQSFPFAQLLVRVLYGNMADFVRAVSAMASFQQPAAAAKKTA